MEPGHLLNSALSCSSSANARRLKSRHRYVPTAQQLISLSENNNICVAHWADYQWNAEWAESPAKIHLFIPDTSTHSPGMILPRTARIRLNSLRVGVERFRSCFHKWGMASSVACECGAEEQTVDHVVLQCPIHRPPHGLHSLTVLDDDKIDFLLNTSPEI